MNERNNIRHTLLVPGLPGQENEMHRGNADTLPRQWLLLRSLPRAPQRTTAGILAQRLGEAGFPITKRSVERDLQALSLQFPLEVDDRSKPYGWSWQRDAPTFSLPGMSPLQAAVLLTANAHLHPLLPAHQLKELAPLMDQARRTLAATTGDGETTWPERLAVAPSTQPLLPPETKDNVLVAVHEALYRSRQLEVTYRTRSSLDLKRYCIHPLGLIVRGQVTYLACRFSKYKDVRILAVHRIDSAELLDRAVVAPRGFRINDILPLVVAGFDRGKLIKLKLKMDAAAAEHLLETRLSTDQVITPADEKGCVWVSATVEDTAQLRWWLMGFGCWVEIREPLALRREISKEIQAAGAQYHP